MKKTSDIVRSSGTFKKSLIPVDFNLDSIPSQSGLEKFQVLLREDGSVASNTKLIDRDLYYLLVVESSEDVASGRGVKSVEPCWYQVARDGVRKDYYYSRCKSDEVGRASERVSDFVCITRASESAPTVSAPSVMVVECKHRAAKQKNGRLVKKTRNDYEAARRDVEAFIKENLDLYSQWITLAAKMSIDDRGVIAGPKKKKHITR